MRTRFVIFGVFALPLMSLVACEHNDDEYSWPRTSAKTLRGTWHITTMKFGPAWVDLAQYPYTRYAYSIIFFDNGTYLESGYWGNGTGSYTSTDNTIETYTPSGEIHLRFVIKNLHKGGLIEATLYTHIGRKLQLNIEAQRNGVPLTINVQ